MVLLKNNDVLPLQKSQSTQNKILATTGPNANNQSILGDWRKPQPEENVYTIYEGINKFGYDRLW